MNWWRKFIAWIVSWFQKPARRNPSGVTNIRVEVGS